MRIILLAILNTGMALMSVKGEDVAPAVDKIAEQVRPSVLTVINAGREGYAQGLGTGFVISKDGLVVTNLHVVGEARPIQVELQDGRRPKVTEVVGWSRKDDLIVFRMDVVDVPPLPLGPGAAMTQGAAVVAMGNPLGLRYSVVSGVVSAVREVEGQELIQLAMPIEKGNSGGPLVDMDGKLRGVINMKSAVTDNLGYAIPVATLQAMLAHPSPVKMEHWLTIGRLNEKLWKPMDGSWRQRAGRILARGSGEGFGGRTYCVHQPMPPELPFEVSVRVKFDGVEGAAGLIFCAKEEDTHYGFYPTNGQLRLTRFEGPELSQWTILQDVQSKAYRPKEWNLLSVRVEAEKIRCFVNGQAVMTVDDPHLRGGKVGLCKFRQTEPEFKDFRFGKNLVTAPNEAAHEELRSVLGSLAKGESDAGTALNILSKDVALSHALIEQETHVLEKRLEDLQRLGRRVHEEAIRTALDKVISAEKEDSINLAEATLLIAKLDNPELGVSDYLAELDSMGAEFKASLSPEEQASPLLATRRLVKWLFVERGFHGSQDDYDSKSNSYLNEVMDDREGLPISLSVLFLEIAWRADLPVAGIPLPGHFVVQLRPVDDPASGPYFDAFNAGKELNRSEAIALTGPAAEKLSSKEDIPPATKREILSRILHNLLSRQGTSEPRLALPYLNLLLTIKPGDAQDRLSRAILLFKNQQPKEARADVQWLLDKRPEGIHLERLEAWMERLPD
jgi:serine protease Do